MSATELGAVVALMMQSPLHRDWKVSDAERLIIPPMNKGQRALVTEDGALAAWASWAFLSDEAQQGYVSGSAKIQPDDWNSGQNLWLIDVIAPFGHAAAITSLVRRELRTTGHTGQSIRFRRMKGGKHRYSRALL